MRCLKCGRRKAGPFHSPLTTQHGALLFDFSLKRSSNYSKCTIIPFHQNKIIILLIYQYALLECTWSLTAQ